LWPIAFHADGCISLHVLKFRLRRNVPGVFFGVQTAAEVVRGVRMDGDVASLAAEMMPYMSAAIGAYGAAVLATARDDAADVTVEVGRRLLQKVFGSRRKGEPLPFQLATSAGTPGDGDALGAVWQAVRQVLAADPALAAEVQVILASAPHVTQQATAGRDARIVSNHSMTINHYGPYVVSLASSARRMTGKFTGSPSPGAAARTRAARKQQGKRSKTRWIPGVSGVLDVV
jgi:hypothetical protein